MEDGVVVLGVIDDDHDATTATAAAPAQFAQEGPAGLGVKMTFGLGSDQAAVSDADSAEVADAFTGGRMPADRISD
jgi:hypothetical protein